MRTDSHPDGVANLSPVLKTRVVAANSLYDWACRLMVKLSQCKRLWSVEWKRVEESVTTCKFCADMCMFGGERLKHTGIASNNSCFSAINVACNNHLHKPRWLVDGKFDTASEAMYPKHFACALAAVVHDYCTQQCHISLPRLGKPMSDIDHARTRSHSCVACKFGCATTC